MSISSAPAAAETTDDREYEIGLSLSGAVSAGAYQAGVLDFLLQALTEWDARRAAEPEAVPGWRVRIRAAAGSSAGALSTALLAASLNLETEHVTPDFVPGVSPEPNSLLYAGWVSKFGYQDMFKTSDIDPPVNQATGTPALVKSIMHCDAMPNYAKSVLNNSAYNSTRPIPYWARDMQVFFTTTNLRGAQYAVQDIATNLPLGAFKMLQHIDVLGFQVSDSGKPRIGAHDASSPSSPLKPALGNLDVTAPRETDPIWKTVREAAVASAAFPAVFAPSVISRPLSQVGDPLLSSSPSWPPGLDPVFEYDAVDGAVFMTDPVELVEQALQRSRGEAKSTPLAKSFADATSCVILIDPFPKNVDLVNNSFKPGQLSVWGSLRQLLGAMQDQGRFQYSQISAAEDPDDASKFMIAPFSEETAAGASPLSTAAMEAFAGCLHSKIRAHDFLLGRRNCQQFLQSTFLISKSDAISNPVFGADAALFANDAGYIPIIPLFGKSSVPVPKPAWPKFTPTEKKQLQTDVLNGMRVRFKAVFTAFAHSFGLVKQGIYGLGWNSIVHMIVDMITSKLVNDAKHYLTKAMEVF